MKARNIGAVVIVITTVLVVVGTYLFVGGPAQTQTAGPSDLVVGTAYEVGDFRACQAADGSRRTEWHFAGQHRSLRNQQTPLIDGRGRRIFRVVTNDTSLPAGYMRLRKVTEADPTLEGHIYGDYSWKGVVVEYNGRVERQRVVRPCGPTR